MAKKLISSGSTFEKDIAYSRAIIVDNNVFVSGTTGYNYSAMTISDNIEDQVEQCLQNIKDVLLKANSKMEDVVRVTYILPHAEDFEKCWPTLRKYFGEIRPAATMFEAKLANNKMKIEIQVDAIIS